MSVLLFYRRMVPFHVLASIKPGLCLSSRHFGSALAKELARQKLRSPSNALSSLVRLRQFSSKTAKETSTFMQAVKYILIGTGALFWCQVVYEFGQFLTGRLPISRLVRPTEELHLLYKIAAVYQFDLSTYKEEGNALGYNLQAISKEVEEKRLALLSVWSKLKSEEAFLRKFGKNVDITGVKVLVDIPSSFNNSDDKSKNVTNDDTDTLTEGKDMFNSEFPYEVSSLTDDKGRSDKQISTRDTWKVSFYIDGSESSGLITMMFQKVTSNKALWVPVGLMVETLPSSGVQICRVSAPAPNGLSRFTRLFIDQ